MKTNLLQQVDKVVREDAEEEEARHPVKQLDDCVHDPGGAVHIIQSTVLVDRRSGQEAEIQENKWFLFLFKGNLEWCRT